jgi:hypothetical protein
LGIPDRASLPLFVERIAPTSGAVVPLRGAHKFLNRIGLGKNKQWKRFNDNPPGGYEQDEWRKKWACGDAGNPPIIVVGAKKSYSTAWETRLASPRIALPLASLSGLNYFRSGTSGPNFVFPDP